MIEVVYSAENQGCVKTCFETAWIQKELIELVGLDFASEVIIDLKIDSMNKWKEVDFKTLIY